MRWLCDECVDGHLVRALRDTGHDAVTVPEISPRADDADVVAIAEAEQRLLLTEDKDFGELVLRNGDPVPGLVLLRIRPADRASKWRRLNDAIDHFGASLMGRFTVIEVGRFRSRPLLGK